MKSKKMAWMSVLVVAVAGVMAANTALAAEKDDQGIRQAVAQFYTALNTMFTGELGPMKEVWSHANDVTYMGPGGGFEVGWDQGVKNGEEKDAMKLGGKVEQTEMG